MGAPSTPKTQSETKHIMSHSSLDQKNLSLLLNLANYKVPLDFLTPASWQKTNTNSFKASNLDIKDDFQPKFSAQKLSSKNEIKQPVEDDNNFCASKKNLLCRFCSKSFH